MSQHTESDICACANIQALRIILLSNRFLKKETRKEILGPSNPKIHRGQRVPPFKDQRDHHGRFKVYFRMSEAQFDAMLAIPEPRIKKKTNNFCQLSVQGSIYSALCCEMKWIHLTIAILDFGVRLYGGSELSKHLSKCLLRMQKTPKKSVSVRRTKISEAVCNRDWHNVRSYLFFYVRTFWTQCAMNLRSYLLLLCEILWAKSSHSKRPCACTRETSAQSSLDTRLWTSIFGSSTSSL